MKTKKGGGFKKERPSEKAFLKKGNPVQLHFPSQYGEAKEMQKG
jgi:hypothetical protein